jgi:hypothetical protein
MDWIRFLEENNIHFVSRGPNTKKNEVSLKCPMCMEDDPSEHLGVNLQNGYWGCLRDQSHRGKSSRTLIKAILGCSSAQAGLIVKQYSHSDPDSLEAALDTLVSYGQVDEALKIMDQKKPEPEFNSFSQIKTRGITRRFYDYLEGRGYETPHNMIQHYNLRCALTGRYKDRINIPIYHNNELLGWTSRAIGSPKNAPRYLASSEDVKTTVFNYDELQKGGRRLFIVEGPFDAIKVDNFGRQLQEGYRATCTFGTSVTLSQIALLRALVGKFEQTWIMFDKGAEGPARNLSDWVGCKTADLPYDVDDPGDLSNEGLVYMADGHYWGHTLLPPMIQGVMRQRTSQLANSLMRNNALLKRLTNKP